MLVFRRGELCDVEAVAALHAESWCRSSCGRAPDATAEGAAEATWQRRLARERPDELTLLALSGSDLLGFIYIVAAEHRVWGSYIENLHVRPDVHRRGVGSQLLGHGAEWLGHNFPKQSLYLWTLSTNAIARQFYERSGAILIQTMVTDDAPDGAVNCRYAWASPASVLRALRKRSGYSASSGMDSLDLGR